MLPAHRIVKQTLPAVTYPQIKALERAIATQLEPIEMPLEHHFIPGVYVRKLTMPAGAVAVGKMHSQEHMFIVAKGRVLVVSEQGEGKELEAGDVFVSGPGIKRAAYFLEETVLINVHTNDGDEQDPEALEAKFVAPEAISYTRTEAVSWRG